MNYKYKVGDKVKIIKSGSGYADECVGQIVEILELGHYVGLGYRTTIPEKGDSNAETGGYNGMAGEDSFKLVEDIPEYVECIKDYMNQFTAGRIYQTASEFGMVLQDNQGKRNGFSDVNIAKTYFKVSTKETFENQVIPTIAVFCTHKKEWNFICEKLERTNKDWDEKYPCQIIRPDHISNNWRGSIDFCKEQEFEIISFINWCNLNNYKFKIHKYDHYTDREKVEWTTEKGKKYLIKDLSNRHLDNIIIWVEKRISNYSEELLDFLKTEQAYRDNNDIHITDERPNPEQSFQNIRVITY